MEECFEIKEFVKREMAFDNSGHGYMHAMRVFSNAKQIANAEGGNEKIILTSALLHDLIDDKLFKNKEKQISKITHFLKSQNYSSEEIDSIKNVISNISWRNREKNKLDKNSQIVSDADRLDAMGAMGIVRTIEYGNSKGREFYNQANLNKVKNKYTFGKANNSTLSHFYEKLIKLKDSLYTKKAKTMAKSRHKFLLMFLKEFYNEL